MLYVPLYRHQLNARVYKNVSWLFNLWLALFIAHIRCIFDSCVLFFCTTPTHTTTTTETARTIHPPSDHCSPLITIVLVRTTLYGYLSHHLRRHAISLHIVHHLHRFCSALLLPRTSQRKPQRQTIPLQDIFQVLETLKINSIPPVLQPSVRPVCLSHNHSCGQGLSFVVAISLWLIWFAPKRRRDRRSRRIDCP